MTSDEGIKLKSQHLLVLGFTDMDNGILFCKKIGDRGLLVYFSRRKSYLRIKVVFILSDNQKKLFGRINTLTELRQCWKHYMQSELHPEWSNIKIDADAAQYKIFHRSNQPKASGTKQ